MFRVGIEQLNWDFNEGKGKKTEFEVGETYNVLMHSKMSILVTCSAVYC